MVDSALYELFQNDSTDKQFHIYTSGAPVIHITNTDLHQQQFELNESLCSESELRFGSCEAASVKFTISNNFMPLKGREIRIQIGLTSETEHKSMWLGTYKVYSDKPTADRTKREIVGYDAMYDIINADVTEWYNSILPTMDSKVSLWKFRTSFLSHFHLSEIEGATPLINDHLTITRTLNVIGNNETDTDTEQTSTIGQSISGKDVITAICEINGCFGHIARNGRFQFVYLPRNIQGLYPADFLYPNHVPKQWDYLPQKKTGSLYPQAHNSTRIRKSFYISANYEDYVVRSIDSLQIRLRENDIGVTAGEGDNTYIIENNFLVYDKPKGELEFIAKTILEQIKDVIYRPFSAECVGNPCLEVGDPIRLTTKYELIESYILKRTLKGIQSLRDSISSTGEEYRTGKINSAKRELIQLNGKSNILTRTLNETRSELTSFEKDTNGKVAELNSSIQQTARDITLEVSKREEGQNELSSRIEQTVSSIDLCVNNGEKTAGITIKVKNENGEQIGNDVSGTIAMTGVVTFNNLASDGQTIINGSNITTGTINCDLLNGGTIEGQHISGGVIGPLSGIGNTTELHQAVLENCEIKKMLILNEEELDFWNSNGRLCGFSDDLIYLNSAIVDAESDCRIGGSLYIDGESGGNLPSGITVRSGGANIKGEIKVSGGRIYTENAICPSINGGTSCGGSDYHWTQVFADKGTITTSQSDKKRKIKEISKKYEDLFFDLSPIIYMFENGDRIHIGTTAEKLKEAMNNVGLENTELSAYCEDCIDGEVTKGIRYSEFIMLNTHMIQKAYKKIEKQQADIDSLKESVSFLMERVKKYE